MRKSFLIAALVAVPAAALAIPALAAPRTKEVKVGDNYFVTSRGVPEVTVYRDDTVRWRFEGRRPHTATVRSGPVEFSSPTKSSGTYSKKMTRSGEYVIYCSIHGRRDQSMRLIVRRSRRP